MNMKAFPEQLIPDILSDLVGTIPLVPTPPLVHEGWVYSHADSSLKTYNYEAELVTNIIRDSARVVDAVMCSSKVASRMDEHREYRPSLRSELSLSSSLHAPVSIYCQKP